MLNEAVLVMKGEKEETEDFETAIDIKVDAYIPSHYIRNELQKLNMYKRISTIDKDEEYEDMHDELQDRFGDVPKPVSNLLKIALLKSKAHNAHITEISGDKLRLKFVIYNKAKIDINKIPDMLNGYRNEMKFIKNGEPFFEFMPKQPMKNVDDIFEKADCIINSIMQLHFS